MYFLYIAFHLLEIYDPAEQSQDTLRPNEEEVTGFEQKISMVRKFVWGCTANVQVEPCSLVEKKKTRTHKNRGELSSRGVSSLNRGR